jgi:toxin YoeB
MGKQKDEQPQPRIARKLELDPNALEDLAWFAEHEPKLARKAIELMKYVLREPHSGPGKPEPLKGFPNTWSRRLTQEHRFVYVVFDDKIYVTALRYHYGDD